MKHDPIMERMKNNYETRSRSSLTRRTPVIMRIDGKAFHTYTKGCKKPFDSDLIEDMNETAIYLCQNIQGAKCAYVQSDEISILITDYDELNTQAWFDYDIQKMTSISASLATGIFNQLRFQRNILQDEDSITSKDYSENLNIPLANFDSRVFNIPKEEVANYFLARQKDAVKNSIASTAQSLYSQKELYGKNQSDLQEMIFQKGINWNDYHFGEKRGRFIKKITYVNDQKVSDDNLETYNKGDILYVPKEKKALIWDDVDYFTTPSQDWIELSIKKVRHKWEVVETPMVFSEKDFKEWI